MDFQLWVAFVVACAVISLIPGPSVFMVTGQAIARGLPAALFCIAGDVLGGVVLMTLSLFGVGAILAASATLFQAVKWAGILYMAYLGFRQIVDARSARAPIMHMSKSSNIIGSLRIGFLTGILNPKAIIFYMAFLTQFMDPARETLLQFSILVATSTFVVFVILAGYALVAAQARKTFQSAKARRRFGYAGGGFMLGGSVLMATR